MKPPIPTCCPHCRQPLPPSHGITIDACTVRYNGKSVRLTRQEADAVTLLLRRIGQVVPHYALYDEMCNSAVECNRDYPSKKIINVLIYKIRRRLSTIGLVISTEWAVGYKLERPGQPQTVSVTAPYRRVNGAVARN